MLNVQNIHKHEYKDNKISDKLLAYFLYIRMYTYIYWKYTVYVRE